MANYNWTKKIDAVGIEAIADKDVIYLRLLANKLQTDYVKFFEELATLYSPNGHKGRKIKEYAIKSNDTGKKIERALQGMVSGEELSEALNDYEDIARFEKEIYAEAITTKALSSRLDKVKEKTGVGIGELRQSDRTMQAKIKAIGKGSVLKSMGRMADVVSGTPLARTIMEGGRTAISQALGPFGELLGEAGETAFTLGKKIYDWRRHRKEKRMVEALRPMATGSDMSKFTELAESVLSTKLGVPFRKKHISKRIMDRIFGRDEEDEYEEKDVAVSNVRTNAKKTNLIHTSFIGTLVDFYNKDAMKTQWTKSVLENLEEIKKCVCEGGGLSSKTTGDTKRSISSLITPLKKYGLIIGATVTALAGLGIFAKNVFAEGSKIQESIVNVTEKVGDLTRKSIDTVAKLGKDILSIGEKTIKGIIELGGKMLKGVISPFIAMKDIVIKAMRELIEIVKHPIKFLRGEKGKGKEKNSIRIEEQSDKIISKVGLSGFASLGAGLIGDKDVTVETGETVKPKIQTSRPRINIPSLKANRVRVEYKSKDANKGNKRDTETITAELAKKIDALISSINASMKEAKNANETGVLPDTNNDKVYGNRDRMLDLLANGMVGIGTKLI